MIVLLHSGLSWNSGCASTMIVAAEYRDAYLTSASSHLELYECLLAQAFSISDAISQPCGELPRNCHQVWFVQDVCGMIVARQCWPGLRQRD
jgi:hypothetical protein